MASVTPVQAAPEKKAAKVKKPAKKAAKKAKKPAKGKCVMKAGEGIGSTRGAAEFQAFEIIQQVTGNWPIQTDHITKPKFRCKQGGPLGWTCRAQAQVCKK